jgi:hypothetical protein
MEKILFSLGHSMVPRYIPPGDFHLIKRIHRVYLTVSSKGRIFNDMILTEMHLNLAGYPDCHPLWPGRGKMI